jgi:hypothetical protein
MRTVAVFFFRFINGANGVESSDENSVDCRWNRGLALLAA